MPRRTSEDVARTRAFWASSKSPESAAPAYAPDAPVWWHVTLALAAALVFQASFAPALGYRGATVSFVTLLVAWYALRTGWAYGLLFGLIAGSCEDALAGSSGVAWTFATGLVGLGVGVAARTPFADSKIVLVSGAFAVTLARYAAFAIAMQVQNRPLALPEAHLHAALWASALDAVAAFAIVRFGPEIGMRLANRR